MERNFYNEDFEDFIREKADQYKIFPSDKAWDNINHSLHGRKKLYLVSMFLLITGIFFIAGKELLLPSNVHGYTAVNKIAENKIVNVPEKNVTEARLAPVFDEFKPGNTGGDRADGSDGQDPDHLLAGSLQPGQNEAPTELAGDERYNEARHHDAFNSSTVLAVPESTRQLWFNDDHLQTTRPEEIAGGAATAMNAVDKKQSTLLQTVAPYELTSIKKPSRKYVGFYLSPTVNYRTLSGADINNNQKPNVQNGPWAPTLGNGNPNQYTNNKPAIGFEIGSDLLYRITRNLSFKVGLQFNYSRYSINAYASSAQPATISLYSVNGYVPNTITSYTNIGNIGGQASVNLQNQYLQLSLPIGFEVRIMGNEKIQLNVAVSAQPSYLMNRNSYLLTADYTNYTQDPSLFRRWNINGALEAFVSYKIGSIRWQIGPELRYQFLSSYSSQYPLNENLKGLGVKLGMSKTIW